VFRSTREPASVGIRNGVGCNYSVHHREQAIWTWRRTRASVRGVAGGSPTHQVAPLRS
jgi:hypothetical protein